VKLGLVLFIIEETRGYEFDKLSYPVKEYDEAVR